MTVVSLDKWLDDAESQLWGLAGTGPVYQLEQRFKELTGHQYALAMSNATTALTFALIGLGIQKAEVITTPLTWGGSLTGIFATGCTPVFADVDPISLTLNPAAVRRCVTQCTKAILAVDLFGYPCHAAELRAIAHKFGLVLIQDCASSLWSYRNVHSGSLADVTVFSLGVNKPLTCGEGAVLLTENRQDLYDYLIYHTQHPLRQRRDVVGKALNEFGTNARIHPLSAYLAMESYDACHEEHCRRQTAISKLITELTEEKLIWPNIEEGVRPAWQRVSVRPRRRQKLNAYLASPRPKWRIRNGLDLIPLYHHASFERLRKRGGLPTPTRCKIAEKQCQQRVTLMEKENRTDG